MKKIVVVLVIIAAIVVAPFITGKLIENHFENKVALINSKLEKVFHQKDLIKLEYHAGWFSSSAKTTIGDVVMNHHIVHGPYCTFGVAQVDSTFNIPEKAEKELATLFDGKKPYSITTKLGFSGTTHLNIQSPAFGEKELPNNPKVKIVWQGLELSSDITKNTVSSTFSMPKFVFKEGNGTLSIENIKSQSKGDRLFDNELNFVLAKNFKMDSDASIGKITFDLLNDSQPVNIQINNITSQMKTDSNNYTGNFVIENVIAKADLISFSTDNISMNSVVNDPFWILRNNLKEADWNSNAAASAKNIKFNYPEKATQVALDYHQEQQLTDNDNKIGYRELYRASNINIQFPRYGNFINGGELSYQINGLPKEQLSIAFANYIDFIKHSFMSSFNKGFDKYSSGDSYAIMQQYENKLMTSGQNLAVATLQSTPDVIVDFKLQGNKGDANVNFKASLIKPDTSTTNIQQLAMGALPRINAKLSVNAAESLIDAVAQQVELDEEQLVDLKHEAKQRYPIIDSNGQYSVEVEFKDNSFYVNGELDPTFLQKYSREFR
ncbi:YdgA family protein [Entomomonas sp. E2T0]|uniref:YdgA family protein n=1 Tax=Entomomonas sp. E2T0 TaxID=2930213 RepID=UPI00222838A0|nr:YdgA family protein [Entomomonas sp. E2T0]UYZ84442.1 YdgA family protein [Entomomonas sp. E2T0]